jgi:hypothetical protein
MLVGPLFAGASPPRIGAESPRVLDGPGLAVEMSTSDFIDIDVVVAYGVWSTMSRCTRVSRSRFEHKYELTLPQT